MFTDLQGEIEARRRVNREIADYMVAVVNAPHVTPQLKHPSWHRDAHSGRFLVDSTPEPLSDEGQRIADRKERRKAKRLTAALRGEFTPVPRRRDN